MVGYSSAAFSRHHGAPVKSSRHDSLVSHWCGSFAWLDTTTAMPIPRIFAAADGPLGSPLKERREFGGRFLEGDRGSRNFDSPGNSQMVNLLGSPAPVIPYFIILQVVPRESLFSPGYSSVLALSWKPIQAALGAGGCISGPPLLIACPAWS